jgi:hypothetical protein
MEEAIHLENEQQYQRVAICFMTDLTPWDVFWTTGLSYWVQRFNTTNMMFFYFGINEGASCRGSSMAWCGSIHANYNVIQCISGNEIVNILHVLCWQSRSQTFIPLAPQTSGNGWPNYVSCVHICNYSFNTGLDCLIEKSLLHWPGL